MKPKQRWAIDERTSDNTQHIYRIKNNKQDGVALVCGSLEDAKLIAAAPELLEASQLLIKYLTEIDGQDNPFTRSMERAIAKATGGDRD